MSSSTTKVSAFQSEVAEIDPRTERLVAKVVYADLDDDSQQAIIETTVSAFDKFVFQPTKKSVHEEKRLLERQVEREKLVQMSKHIKEGVDARLGPSWHVIFGRSFATFVTHERFSFMHFQIDDADVVVWKHG
jgi:hypothetical protein